MKLLLIAALIPVTAIAQMPTHHRRCNAEEEDYIQTRDRAIVCGASPVEVAQIQTAHATLQEVKAIREEIQTPAVFRLYRTY